MNEDESAKLHYWRDLATTYHNQIGLAMTYLREFPSFQPTMTVRDAAASALADYQQRKGDAA